VSDSGRNGVENGTFWRQQALAVTRWMLHASALDSRPPSALYPRALTPIPEVGRTGKLSFPLSVRLRSPAGSSPGVTAAKFGGQFGGQIAFSTRPLAANTAMISP
jgi:hypothetical protein